MSLFALSPSRVFGWAGADVAALGYMLVALLAFSVIPLVVELSGGSANPFFFNMLVRSGGFLGSGIFLVVFYRRIVFCRQNLRLIMRRLFFWPDNRLLLITFLGGASEFTLLAASVRFLDVAVVAVLFEVYPVLIIFVASRVFRDTRQYRRLGGLSKLLILMSMFGFIFAVVSQNAGFFDSFAGASLLNLLLGICLVAGAILGCGASVFGWRWGRDLGSEMTSGLGTVESSLLGMVVALWLTCLVASVVSGVGGLVVGENIDWHLGVFGLGGGLVITCFGAICHRKSNLLTRNVGINSMGYVVPVFSLVWLYWIAGVDVARWDYLILGMVLIVAANLLMHFEADVRRAVWALRFM